MLWTPVGRVGGRQRHTAVAERASFGPASGIVPAPRRSKTSYTLPLLPPDRHLVIELPLGEKTT